MYWDLQCLTRWHCYIPNGVNSYQVDGTESFHLKDKGFRHVFSTASLKWTLNSKKVVSKCAERPTKFPLCQRSCCCWHQQRALVGGSMDTTDDWLNESSMPIILLLSQYGSKLKVEREQTPRQQNEEADFFWIRTCAGWFAGFQQLNRFICIVGQFAGCSHACSAGSCLLGC